MRAAPAPAATPTIFLRGIGVRFGQNVALDDVDLDLAPGARHAVVGENGAGKSTLMKVLFGLLRPDRGEILVDGRPRRFGSPKDAIALGIGMVHQHFELIEPFTVAENVVLGAEPATRGLFQSKQARARVAGLSEESGLPIDPDARVEQLSVASRQRVEILKALYRRARVLVLDEPTAVLAPAEARDLWAATLRLSQAGTTIVFITHKLDEVMAHADAVTVLRRGKRVLHAPVRETNAERLAAAMVGEAALTPVPSPLLPAFAGGRGVPEASSTSAARGADAPGVPSREAAVDGVAGTPLPPAKAGSRGEGTGVRAVGPGEGTGVRAAVLSLRNLTVRGRRGEVAVDDVSLDLAPGEILGLAGVDGSGQQELIEAVLGLRAAQRGAITLLGWDVRGLSVAQRRAAGIGYVPEDRHGRALVLPLSVEENAVLGRQREPAFAGTGGLLRGGAVRTFLAERAQAFDVRGATAGLPARALSGGNQQKLVLARELSRRPALLLASQPTRGLDFAASAFVHEALRAERDRGAAVLLQSLDLDEVLALSDRVAVMLRGKIVAVLPCAEATEARVGALMTGASA